MSVGSFRRSRRPLVPGQSAWFPPCVRPLLGARSMPLASRFGHARPDGAGVAEPILAVIETSRRGLSEPRAGRRATYGAAGGRAWPRRSDAARPRPRRLGQGRLRRRSAGARLLRPMPTRRDARATRAADAATARSRSHPDLVIGSPDAWRELRATGESIVAVARRWLLDAAGAPIAAARRVVLVERADRANEQIQNALLKALEEPTDRHVFILVADEPGALLPTIRSRCQPIRIGPVPREELAAYLMDIRRLPADQADVLARISGGLTGRALSLRRRHGAAGLAGAGADGAALPAGARARRPLRIGPRSPGRDGASQSAGRGRAGDEAQARTPASAQRGAAAMLVEVWLSLTRDLIVAAVGRAELAPSRELAPELESLAETHRPGEAGPDGRAARANRRRAARGRIAKARARGRDARLAAAAAAAGSVSEERLTARVIGPRAGGRLPMVGPPARRRLGPRRLGDERQR